MLLADGVDDVATPVALVTTVSLVAPPKKADAPEAGAVNVTCTPCSGLAALSFSDTFSGLANAVPVRAVWPEPLTTVNVVGPAASEVTAVLSAWFESPWSAPVRAVLVRVPVDVGCHCITTVALLPTSICPTLHTVEPAWQVPCEGVAPTIAPPALRASDTSTLVASSGPELVTVSVRVYVWPRV